LLHCYCQFFNNLPYQRSPILKNPQGFWVFEYDQNEHKTLILGQNRGFSASDNGSRHDISTENEVSVNLGRDSQKLADKCPEEMDIRQAQQRRRELLKSMQDQSRRLLEAETQEEILRFENQEVK